MDSELQEIFKVEKEKKIKEGKQATVSIFHRNVQAVNNKVLELNMILQTELGEVDVLCLSEHWLKEDYIKLISIDDYNLTSKFSRSNSTHGGTCIYVRQYLQRREIKYIQGISKEKDFEISAVEIVD